MNYLSKLPLWNRGFLDFPPTINELFRRFDQWKPSVDVLESPGEYVLSVELPGIDAKDVQVTVSGDTLTIRGDKQREEKSEDATWCIAERSHGSFERSFTFASPITPDGVKAEASNGVLSIHVQKTPEAKTHQVKVKTR
ncbi:MAG: Hsp20/alpha crystallin family protein [Planctomycetota bacterium]